MSSDPAAQNPPAENPAGKTPAPPGPPRDRNGNTPAQPDGKPEPAAPEKLPAVRRDED